METPFSHILLATEDTEFDVGAESIAIDLAAATNKPLMAVLPIVSNPIYQTVAPERAEEDEEAAAAKMDKLVQNARNRNVELLGNVRMGEEPWEEIVEEASDREADLIVLRRRGKKGFLANALFGEMVHTVTGHVHCDVLLVPRAAKLWNKGIMLATDGSDSSLRAASLAAQLAVAFKLPLTVVSAMEHGETDEQAANERIELTIETIRTIGAQTSGRVISATNPSEAIAQAYKELDADLIVIGRRGLNMVKRAFVGSTSEWVASHADCATLIVQSAVGTE